MVEEDMGEEDMVEEDMVEEDMVEEDMLEEDMVIAYKSNSKTLPYSIRKSTRFISSIDQLSVRQSTLSCWLRH